MQKVFYTDGGCRGNGTLNSHGGWGWIEVVNDRIENFNHGSESNTTNNRMELTALLEVLQYIDKNYPNEEIIIYSDSAYVVNSVTQWSYNWYRNDWRRAGDKPIENLDLIQQIYDYYNKNFNRVQLKKCRGHAGNAYNEIVDALTWSVEKFLKSVRKNKVQVRYEIEPISIEEIFEN